MTRDQLTELQDFLLEMDRRMLALVTRIGRLKYSMEPKPWRNRQPLPLNLEDLDL